MRKDVIMIETFKFLKSAILLSLFRCYSSHNFEAKDSYGSHQVSLHIYFNMDTVFYKILSSWHNATLG